MANAAAQRSSQQSNNNGLVTRKLNKDKHKPRPWPLRLLSSSPTPACCGLVPPIEGPEAPTFRPQLAHFQPATASRRLLPDRATPSGPSQSPSLCLIPAASTQLQLSPRSLLAGAGNMERPTPDASLDSALRHRPKPKADTSLLPASGCNPRKYGGLDYQVRNKSQVNRRSHLVYGG
jgi:hypothetical protein